MFSCIMSNNIIGGINDFLSNFLDKAKNKHSFFGENKVEYYSNG